MAAKAAAAAAKIRQIEEEKEKQRQVAAAVDDTPKGAPGEPDQTPPRVPALQHKYTPTKAFHSGSVTPTATRTTSTEVENSASVLSQFEKVQCNLPATQSRYEDSFVNACLEGRILFVCVRMRVCVSVFFVCGLHFVVRVCIMQLAAARSAAIAAKLSELEGGKGAESNGHVSADGTADDTPPKVYDTSALRAVKSPRVGISAHYTR